MKVTGIIIENFRGIEHMDIHLNGQVTLLAGVNGSGKSTILDAISLLLSWYPAFIRSDQGKGSEIKDDDIKNNSNSASLTIHTGINDHMVFWKQVKTLTGRLKKEVSRYADLKSVAKNFQEMLSTNPASASIPIVAHYPVNRAVLDIPVRIRKKHTFDDPIFAYEEAFTGAANFRLFFEWFREREDIENEMKVQFQDSKKEGEEAPLQTNDLCLNAVREAITTFTQFQNLRIQRRPPTRMILEKEGEILSVNPLSDGEKCLMALIGDLARRLAIANPSSVKPLDGNGIILIDEIELHLHPSWQRMIIPQLKATFPNCQFLISSHSPQVISHLKPDEIILLYKDNDHIIQATSPHESYGKNTDLILETITDTSSGPSEIKEKMSRLFLQIDENELPEAKESLESLRALIGDDPDLIKAEILIRRRELIGK
jgi:predicted ATP-binding protein involved in virulence